MNRIVLGLLIAIVIVGIVNVGLLVSLVMKSNKSPCIVKSHKDNNIDQRIIGGHRVSIKHHPFMAAIVVKKHGSVPKDTLQCGSSIIAPKWVVSAAHCIQMLEDQFFTKDNVYISAGSSSWKRGRRHSIAVWEYHENYDNAVLSHDISLIKVNEQFNPKVLEKPIALATEAYKYLDGATVKVIGWGLKRTSDLDIQKWLRGVHVNIYNQTFCRKLYDVLQQDVTFTMFCAGVSQGGKDACLFDSGGPIFDKNTLIGIVSWGIDCAIKNQPGVYTKINLYLEWISKISNKYKEPLKLKSGNQSDRSKMLYTDTKSKAQVNVGQDVVIFSLVFLFVS